MTLSSKQRPGCCYELLVLRPLPPQTRANFLANHSHRDNARMSEQINEILGSLPHDLHIGNHRVQYLHKMLR